MTSAPTESFEGLISSLKDTLQNSPALTTHLSTVIVLPDATRPLPFVPLLTALLDLFDEHPTSTTLLIGQGLHRKMTTEELQGITTLLSSRSSRADLLQHDAQKAPFLGTTKEDQVPVALHRELLKAERILVVSTVEPHQYAGFSGGSKGISIGCAGRETISAMHGLSFLRDENTTLGSIKKNPFRRNLDEILDFLCPDQLLGLQCLPAPKAPGKLMGFHFGPLPQAFLRAVEDAKNLYFRDSPPLDWAHLPIPTAKASNFYQASRGATYLALLPETALRKGAPILIEASCPEGMGQGAGEKACAQAMHRGAQQLLEELYSPQLEQENQGGAQRAYVLAKALARNPIALIGSPPIPSLKAFGIPQFSELEQAKQYYQLSGDARLDDIFHRLPCRFVSQEK